MNRKWIQGLYGELPHWVELGALTPEAAERLHAHYGPVESARPARLAVVLFGLFGALLIGSGIILMLAHNWDDLSRPVRAGLSFLPLVLAQGLAGWTLALRSRSLAWREGSASLAFLMIGASISLVAQTYNISGDLPRFLLTWSLLGLPLVYLFDAAVPALLYLWGITEWGCHLRCENSFNAGYWILAALLLPLVARWSRAGRYRPRLTLLMWAICISVTVAAGVTVERVLPGLWIMLYAGLFALLLLIGEFWFRDGDGGFWSRPLRHFGAAGVLVFSFMLTFEWPWHAIGWHHGLWTGAPPYATWQAIPDAVLGSLVPLGALVLLVMTVRRKTSFGLLFGCVPVVAAVGYCVASLSETYAPSAGLFDLYLFVLGLWLLVSGLRNSRQGQMNVGLLALAALVIARFFDGDLSFLLRGLVFIVLGIAFLVANVVLLRRKGESHAQA